MSGQAFFPKEVEVLFGERSAIGPLCIIDSSCNQFVSVKHINLLSVSFQIQRK